VRHISVKDVNSASNTSSFFKSRRLQPEAKELFNAGTGADHFLVDRPHHVRTISANYSIFKALSGNVRTCSLPI
jgi:hypothetical protein